jgi:phage shock protein PspC (stress-responsive transcriptional regulator)
MSNSVNRFVWIVVAVFLGIMVVVYLASTLLMNGGK